MNIFKSAARVIFGKKIGKTRIFPIATKIIFLFVLFLLVSNLSSNYLNLMWNRSELIQTMKEMLIKDLKEMYDFSNNQYEIFQFNKNRDSALKNIESKALRTFKKKKSLLLGVYPNGELIFKASKTEHFERFTDRKNLKEMTLGLQKGKAEGFLTISLKNDKYFGVYKYNKQWGAFIFRGEETNEFYKRSRAIFRNISIIIIIFTVLATALGVYVLRYFLRYLNIMTTGIMQMIKHQKMDLIDLEGASNDEITFLGASFNSLSSTIDNLINIFRKFANKDIAIKAYRDRNIKLEGTPKDLTCLFSDIKSFTTMTETLGTDIINLLNMHYDKAIREILKNDGVIGSIIGDALLAVFGALDEGNGNKSYQAIQSAYEIQDVAHQLRLSMHQRREEIIAERGALSVEEEKVYQAVLIEVGVGIDGGVVFYGNIGSYERMTNTVIGDNVNSSSRLEGLTRVYKVPVICSEYIMNDVIENVPNHGMTFIELDQVQVKGKTIGKRVYWPILNGSLTENLLKNIKFFSKGLQLYYDGDWAAAYQEFAQCKLPLAEVFVERTQNNTAPQGWDGIWTMKTK